MADIHADKTFTEDEFAFLRHARYGEMPAPVPPDQRVELTETDPRRDRPEPAGNLDSWDVRHGGG